MDVSVVGGCLKQDVVLGRQRKRVKVMVEPGSKECVAGYETKGCKEMRVRLRRLVGIWEVGHRRVRRWMLLTERGLQKGE